MRSLRSCYYCSTQETWNWRISFSCRSFRWSL